MEFWMWWITWGMMVAVSMLYTYWLWDLGKKRKALVKAKDQYLNAMENHR